MGLSWCSKPRLLPALVLGADFTLDAVSLQHGLAALLLLGVEQFYLREAAVFAPMLLLAVLEQWRTVWLVSLWAVSLKQEPA